MATTYEQLFSTFVADVNDYAAFLGKHAGEPINGAAASEVVKAEFRKRLQPDEAIAAVDRGLKATRDLQALHVFMGHCSISESDGLRIIVSTTYAPEPVRRCLVIVHCRFRALYRFIVFVYLCRVCGWLRL